MGAVELRDKKWTFRTTHPANGKRLRIVLGTLAELPTRKDAELAVRYVNAVGAGTVAALIEQRHRKSTSAAKYTASWFMEKLIEQGYTTNFN